MWLPEAPSVGGGMIFDIHGIVLGKRCAVFGYLDGKPVLGGGKTFFIALGRALKSVT